MTKNNQSTLDLKCPDLRGLPVTFHCHVVHDFCWFAAEARLTEKQLWTQTIQGLHDRHQEAFIAHEANRATETRPDLFTLLLGGEHGLMLFFTVDGEFVIIRGYSWELDHGPADDRDGGYSFFEPS